MSKAAILPPNATPLDKAVLTAVASPADMTGDVAILSRVEDCPDRFLPYLAWALSVDDWDANWSDETKRSAVAASVLIHRRKGTVGAVRSAIAASGYGNAIIVEGQEAFQHNNTIGYDGLEIHGGPDHWAEYRVYLDRPITIDQADQLKSILKNVAPARCRLKGLYFTEAAHRFNAAIIHDGSFTHGAVQ